MASHASIIQICNHTKILIHLFIFVLSSYAQTTPFTLPTCWRKIPQKTYYGVTNEYEKTLDACMEKCVKTRYCQIINYQDGAERPCWIYKKVIDESKFEHYESYDIYRLDGECLMGPCWTKHPKVRFFGLTRARHEKTLITCAERCLKTKNGCKQIVFVHGIERPCFFDEYNRDNIIINYEIHPGIDSYKLDKDCWDLANPIKPTTKRPKIELPKCWEEFENIMYMDLTNTYETTLPKCLENCRKTRNCIAISYKRNSTRPCFMTTESVDLRLSEEDELYDSYVVDEDCIILPAGTCWKKSKNTRFKDLINYKNEKSLITCMETCQTKFAGCAMLSFLYGRSDPCYLGLQKNMTRPPATKGNSMVSYRLDEDCLRRSRAATAITTTTTSTIKKRKTKIGPTTRIGPSNETDPDTETDPDIITDPDTETDQDNWTDQEKWTDPEKWTNPENGNGSDNENDPDIITDPDTRTDLDYENDSNTINDSDYETDSDTNDTFMAFIPSITTIFIIIIIIASVVSIIYFYKNKG